MIATLKNIIYKTGLSPHSTQMGSVEAYNIWADNYDWQPGNLMLDLDEQVFSGLLSMVNIKSKQVADIGCGTGRHWDKLLKNNPASLTGFDVSPGMLEKLQQKFPQANTHAITDNLFSSIPNATYDMIVSTLTVAHIENIDEALKAWCRILKNEGDIIVTDFHPNALAAGGKRTFEHRKKQIAVQNYVHYMYHIKEVFQKYGLHVVNADERIVDDSVRHYYTEKNALPVFERFKGSRIIYGLHLKRG